jgi:hypothetical protein
MEICRPLRAVPLTDGTEKKSKKIIFTTHKDVTNGVSYYLLLCRVIR